MKITFIRPELLILVDLGFSYKIKMIIEADGEREIHIISSEEYKHCFKKINEK
jgi:hypothetical protein